MVRYIFTKGVLVFYIVLYAVVRKSLKQKTIQKIKLVSLFWVFVAALFPNPIKYGDIIFNAQNLIIVIAGLDIVDAYYEYKHRYFRKKENKKCIQAIKKGNKKALGDCRKNDEWQ